jgi:hypothetical protein
MKTYEGGSRTWKGNYLGLKTGEFVTVEASGNRLPGPPTLKYLRIPVGLMLVAGPLIGLAYIIFLPLASIGSVVMLAANKATSGRLAPVDRSSEG